MDPKILKLRIYEKPQQHLVQVFRELARQKESEIEERHLMPGHVHA
jgi:putative transposase